MRRTTDAILALLIPFTIILHLLASPYTKVEESFSIQATHDILTYGIPSPLDWVSANAKLAKQYDHFEFPGSVPRSFVGPFVIAGLARGPIGLLGNSDTRLRQQILVRLVLGLFNGFCILSFRNGVAGAFGRGAANWYVLLQASQFHIMYYASRTLSNFFAFGLCMLALRNFLPTYTAVRPGYRAKRYQHALTYLTIVGIIFRSEIALLLGTHTLWLLLRSRLSIPQVIYPGLLGALIGLSVTVPVDSFFWQHLPLWPEFSAFVYNVIKNRASDWGTSPWHYYFTSALPRLLLNPLSYQLCIPFAILTPALRSKALDILIPNLAFVVLFSFQPHKEWRFIVYIVPPLTAVAAAGFSYIFTHRSKSFYLRILSYILIASTIASFLASTAMLLISSQNYPGADALNKLHQIADGRKDTIRVHLDATSCMTGITHFLEIQRPELPPKPMNLRTIAREKFPSRWVYDKEEDQEKLLMPTFWNQFDYVLTGHPELVIGQKWDPVDTIKGFAGVTISVPQEYEDAHSSTKLLGECGDGKQDGGLWCRARNLWVTFENTMKTKITGGYWPKTKMDDRIWILRREPEKCAPRGQPPKLLKI
ncbi:MAG: dolichyl-P-Man:Man(7)GlcNAc(2)-PP-dolichol alpha-1,6-mannosyltransferase [Icmadophila ericetorum]|nr:dolichyl-P-Man:Man(7)GlcNAc(2)-PP-dolichol alpha-1,6-mannosyltransferase [Icmadophila ericetorum]